MKTTFYICSIAMKRYTKLLKMNTSNTAQQVSTTILNQLGGRKFLAMTGSKNLAYGTNENGNDMLSMHLTRNQSKAKYLTITLMPSDTYCVEFTKADRAFNLITVQKFDNVYAEDLQDIFTAVTGLYTSLGTCAA